MRICLKNETLGPLFITEVKLSASRVCVPGGATKRSILAVAITSGLDPGEVSRLSRDLASGFNSLMPDRRQNGTGSLLHGATCLSKKRCAGNRLARRGSQSLYLASAKIDLFLLVCPLIRHRWPSALATPRCQRTTRDQDRRA